MPVATMSQGKSSFVREFLSKHPEGNVKAVNKAWTDAGMQGTIGDTLIYQTRAEMGLSGKLRAKSKTRPAAMPKSTARKPETAGTPGKGMFVKEFLQDNPHANVDAVNKAWASARFEGTISKALVDKVRAALGLTGKGRQGVAKSKPSTAVKSAVQPRNAVTAPVSVQPRGNESTALEDMEADIDRLIFKAMTLGNLTEIENTLRRARRLLYTSLVKS